MACVVRIELRNRFEKFVEELQSNLADNNIAESRRTSQNMLDAWYRLKEHEEEHRCRVIGK
jgi:hypothetical protein